MKRSRKVLTVALAAAMCTTAAFGLAACAKDTDGTGSVYTISFDANGGTLAAGTKAMVTNSEGKLAEFPADPTFADHTFVGWYTAKTDGTKVTVATAFSASATVYAHWTDNGSGGGTDIPTGEFTITFDVTEPGDDEAHGTLVGSATATTTNGKLATYPTVTADKGYTFLGWFDAAGIQWSAESTDAFTADTTLYAHYEAELVEGDYNLYINEELYDNAMSEGNGGAEVRPDNLVFEYYSSNVELKQGDIVKFVLKDITLASMWAEEGTAIKGVTGTQSGQGVEITGDSVEVLADGTYTVSIKRWQDQVEANRANVYIGPYTGEYEVGGETNPDVQNITADGVWLVGTGIGGGGWDIGVKFTGTDNSGTVTVTLNNTGWLKIRKGSGDNNGSNWVENENDGLTVYDGSNFKVKEAGTYTLTVTWDQTAEKYKVNVSKAD